jgi:uncharacterized membrane protein YtjA (UPF0391 family)
MMTEAEDRLLTCSLNTAEKERFPTGKTHHADQSQRRRAPRTGFQTDAKERGTGGFKMLSWALTFLVIALIAGVLGFGGIAGTAAGIAKILFFVFLILMVVSLVAGRGRT